MMPANELAAVIVKALDAKKGENIQLLKTRDLIDAGRLFCHLHGHCILDAREDPDRRRGCGGEDDVRQEPVLRREGHRSGRLGPARLWLRGSWPRVPGRRPASPRSGSGSGVDAEVVDIPLICAPERQIQNRTGADACLFRPVTYL
ncbi:MAG: hypothetical protein ACLSHG_02035 [Oscillospiraceae bacterium]